MKTRMTKAMAGMMALIMALAMAGCGSSDDSGSKGGSEKSAASGIHYEQQALSNEFFSYQLEIDGDVITLPIQKAELESLGFEIEESDRIVDGASLGHAERDGIRLSTYSAGDMIFELDLSGPDCEGLEGHEVKISGGFTLYKDNYDTVLAAAEAAGGNKGGSYGDEYRLKDHPGSFIRLYNNGTPSDVAASVFISNKFALDDEHKELLK